MMLSARNHRVREGTWDPLRAPFTYPDELIFGTSGQVFPIGAEANAANVEITVLVDGLILQLGHLLA